MSIAKRRHDFDAIDIFADDFILTQPTAVIKILEPLIYAERLRRIDEVIAKRVGSVVPVVEEVSDPHNAAAILRSAEAFGVSELHVVDSEQDFLASNRVAQGSQRWLNVQRHSDITACVAELRIRGFQVYGSVVSESNATSVQQLCGFERIAVVFGNEHSGVSQQAIEACTGTFTIPMNGFVESLNLSVAAAVALYTLTQGRQGDLAPEQREQLRARYMLASVPRALEIVQEQGKKLWEHREKSKSEKNAEPLV